MAKHVQNVTFFPVLEGTHDFQNRKLKLYFDIFKGFKALSGVRDT